MKVALYIRVSTDEQVKYGYSLDAQENRLKEYAESKGYNVVKIYREEGKSARSNLKNRIALAQLLKDAELGLFNRIIFWRLDRWFRNIKDYYKVQEQLDKFKVDWECSDDMFDTSTASGRLNLNVKLAIAQNESDTTSERIKFNFNNMVKNGQPITGSMPIGYKIENKKVVKDEKYSEMITDIFKTYKDTNSLKNTITLINEKYPDLVYKNGFTSRDLSKILQTTMYYGKYRENSNYCEPYLSEQEWLDINNMKNKNIRKNKYTYLFSGIIKGECGHKLSGIYSPNGSHYYYRCTEFSNRGKCSASIIREKLIEEELLKMIPEEIDNYIFKQTPNEPKSNDKEIAKLKSKKQRLIDSYINGWIDNPKNEIENIDLQIKQLQPIKKDYSYLKELSSMNWIDMYNALNRENKQIFFRSFIDYIVVDIKKKGEKDFIKVYFL